MNVTDELEALLVQQGKRIAVLESEVLALKANAGLAHDSRAPAVRPAEEGVRITYPVARTKIPLPSPAEMQNLLDVVLAKYPKLRPFSPGDRFAVQDAANFFQEFCSAFEYVAQLGRADQIDTKRGLTWWTAQATEWCRLGKTPADVKGSPLLAAVIAAGDVAFVERDEFGNVWAFALATAGGVPATEAWRSVLKNGLDERLRRPGVHKSTDRSVRFESANW
jgi:hypothetical protein